MNYLAINMDMVYIIKNIFHGQKQYVTSIDFSSSSYKRSKSPFKDSEILKFSSIEEAKENVVKLIGICNNILIVSSDGKEFKM